MALLKLLDADRSALATTLLAQWNAASGPCTLEFYTTPQPAGPATAITTQTKLGTLACSDPIGTQSTGVITFGAITQDSSADNDGTAAWCRLKDGAGVARADYDVTHTAGSGYIKLNTTTIVSGGPILMTSFTFTIGGN